MLKKIISMLLIVLVMNLMVVTAFAGTDAEKEAKFAEKVKAEVTKLGTGTDAKIQIKLKDGSKLKGYVSEIKDTSFVVTDEKTGATTEIPYPQAKQVKGHNLSTGAKIAIAVGIIVVLSIVISYVYSGRVQF